ncbi:MAG: serine/threonine protein kinase [Kofleriaceae bacterium]|nr:serine/threonine protein kinase [Kofleriaceae bacterium]
MSQRDLIGQVLSGRYRVIAPVGKGAMGSVYRGEHVGLGRSVAIKVIGEEVPGEMIARQRFEREAKAMAKLAHPHCASVLDVGLHGDQPYVVMEFVDGQNLKEVVANGPLPTERAIDITRQILSGLAHAHDHGIIHRDIKPANVVLSQKAGLGDHVKILDFGLAKMNRETSNLTSGVVVGTPSYMAPEQVLGQLLDTRVDLYACGVLLFELLTGTKPFRSANNEPVEVCMQHLHQVPPRLGDVVARDFGGIEGVVAKALAKDREQRYQTAGDFAVALVDAARGAPSAPPPRPFSPARRSATPPEGTSAATVQLAATEVTATPPSKRSHMAWLVGGAALAALAVAAIAIVQMRGEASEPMPAAPVAAAPIDAAIAEPPPAADPVDELLAQAETLSREAAIDLLVKARKTYPDDARLPYHAGLIYLDRMWWADGLKQLRAAIAIDPKYKSDPELIKAVIRGFNTTAKYDWTLASFLRKDIGKAAKPYLEDTANAHPNQLVRKRAAAELRRY